MGDEGPDMKKNSCYNLFIIYLVQEDISEINELQCDTDYGKVYDIFRNSVIYFAYCTLIPI